MDYSLFNLIVDQWRHRLQDLARKGLLYHAAAYALCQTQGTKEIGEITRELSLGNYLSIPEIQLISQHHIPQSKAAYSSVSRTIYISDLWAQSASTADILFVLDEEFGHHLDTLINSHDTPGDEGKFFAELLSLDGRSRAEITRSILSQDDNGLAVIDGVYVQIEQSLITLPIDQASPGRSRGEFKNRYAFAALRNDGSVLTWGSPEFGGDSGHIQHLINSECIQIFSSGGAFLALKSTGEFVTWGSSQYGGDSSTVQSQLISPKIARVYSTERAFCAITHNGAVIAWGDTAYGGDCSLVTPLLSSGILKIFSTERAFAALLENGSVVAWGSPSHGGDTASVATSLESGVIDIFCTRHAFAALKSDGSVVSWGDINAGGNSGSVASELANKTRWIYSTDRAFAALRNDNSIVTWGDSSSGGDSSTVRNNLTGNVKQVFSTQGAFAALKYDGTVTTWGSSIDGGDSSRASLEFRRIVNIVPNNSSFAGISDQGGVFPWGNPLDGGSIYNSSVNLFLRSGVTAVYANDAAYAAVKSNGFVYTWGNPQFGGESTINSLYGATRVYSTGSAFALLQSAPNDGILNGQINAWGNPIYGGSTSQVNSQLVKGNVISFADPMANDTLSIYSGDLISIHALNTTAIEDGLVKIDFYLTRTIRDNPLDVSFKVNGSATRNDDYVLYGANGDMLSGTISFLQGSGTSFVSATINPDITPEGNESIVLRLLPGISYSLNEISTEAIAIIIDDDADLSPPELLTIKVDGQNLELGFSEAVFVDEAGIYRFLVTVDGLPTPVKSWSTSAADSSVIVLTLNGISPASSQEVCLYYSDFSTANDLTSVVQDIAGNDMISIAEAGRSADTFLASTNVTSLANSYSNLQLTGTATTANGNSYNNNISTNQSTAIANVFIGGAGTDAMNAGNGSDVYFIANAADHTAAEISDSGTTGIDEMRFAATTANQTLIVFSGDTGLEQITIGTGTAASADSTAITALSINASAAANGLTITGNAGANSMLGSSFEDVLIGGLGSDFLNGGEGSDLYLITSAADHPATEVINDSGTAGSDEMRFASTTTGETLTVLSSDVGIERLTIGTGNAAAAVSTGTTALKVNAAAAPNPLRIIGNSGNNTITGSIFIDRIDGGQGSDLYIVSNSSHHSGAEYADSGTTGSDELRFAATSAGQTLIVFAGDTGLERITIGTGTGAAAVSTATTALSINASAAVNGLTLTGNGGANGLIGSNFDDILIGGPGNDSINGGDGSDLYLITSAADHPAEELINDSGTSGTDELRFAATIAGQTLIVSASDTGLERITIGTGTAAIPLRTSTTALHVHAAAAPNGLFFLGNAGSNTITGTPFSDTIDGGAGSDGLDGGEASDLYMITSSTHHSAAEIADSGTSGSDELRFASTTTGQILTIFAGDTGLERITIGIGTATAADGTATTALHVNAAAAANPLAITGNAGTNTITGTAFTDTIDGGQGSDLYIVSNSDHHSAAEYADSGTSGSDELRFASTIAEQILIVFSGDIGLERISIGTGTAATPLITAITSLHVNAGAAANALTISGNAGNNSLIGSAFNDTLTGNGGNDTLAGGSGNDTLTGGLGIDTFRFDSTLNAASNVDRITDFSASQGDMIALEDSVFSGFSSTGTLTSADFLAGATATTAAQRILYSPGTGQLLYDPDGNGANPATVFATLNTGLALTSARFFVT